MRAERGFLVRLEDVARSGSAVALGDGSAANGYVSVPLKISLNFMFA